MASQALTQTIKMRDAVDGSFLSLADGLVMRDHKEAGRKVEAKRQELRQFFADLLFEIDDSPIKATVSSTPAEPINR